MLLWNGFPRLYSVIRYQLSCMTKIWLVKSDHCFIAHVEHVSLSAQTPNLGGGGVSGAYNPKGGIWWWAPPTPQIWSVSTKTTTDICHVLSTHDLKMKKEITSEVKQMISSKEWQSSQLMTSSTTDPANDDIIADSELPPSLKAQEEKLVEHKNIVCDHCDSPVKGVRYKCG